MPLVSVIVNCLNGERYLRDCLDSVFAQTYPNWEIVFWDNASSDNSLAIAKSYGDKIRCFQSEETCSLGAARNKAFQEAQGKYIAIIDVDDLWMPEKLAVQVAQLEGNNSLALSFSDVKCFSAHSHSYTAFSLHRPRRGKVFKYLLQRNFIWTVSMMFRRSVLEDFDNWFDERFTLLPDYFFSLRIAYLYDIDYIDRPLAQLRIHDESFTRKKKHLLPQENALAYSLLGETFPGIQERYGGELQCFSDKIALQRAYNAWEDGDITATVNSLQALTDKKKRLVCGVVMRYLPYGWYQKIKKIITVAQNMLGGVQCR